jgi:hypothetical protein
MGVPYLRLYTLLTSIVKINTYCQFSGPSAAGPRYRGRVVPLLLDCSSVPAATFTINTAKEHRYASVIRPSNSPYLHLRSTLDAPADRSSSCLHKFPSFNEKRTTKVAFYHKNNKITASQQNGVHFMSIGSIKMMDEPCR